MPIVPKTDSTIKNATNNEPAVQIVETASAATLFVMLYFVALAAEGSLFYAAHWLAYGV